MNKGTINYLCKIGLSKVKYDDDIFVYYYTTIQHCIKLFYKIKFFSYLPTHFLKPLLPETHLYFFLALCDRLAILYLNQFYMLYISDHSLQIKTLYFLMQRTILFN